MAIFELPHGYAEIRRIDLLKDKRAAVLVNVAALTIALVMLIIGWFIAPVRVVQTEAGSWFMSISVIRMLIVVAAMILYIVIHELIHGTFFKLYSGKRAKYGFGGWYAYAASDAYYYRREYLIIGLSPVIICGIALLALNIILPAEWFWGVYFIQVMNISGAAGDIYVTGIMSRLPADILVYDEGVAMSIYAREEQEK